MDMTDIKEQNSILAGKVEILSDAVAKLTSDLGRFLTEIRPKINTETNGGTKKTKKQKKRPYSVKHPAGYPKNIGSTYLYYSKLNRKRIREEYAKQHPECVKEGGKIVISYKYIDEKNGVEKHGGDTRLIAAQWREVGKDDALKKRWEARRAAAAKELPADREMWRRANPELARKVDQDTAEVKRKNDIHEKYGSYDAATDSQGGYKDQPLPQSSVSEIPSASGGQNVTKNHLLMEANRHQH